MSWDKARSEERIQEYIDQIGEIEIEPMTRTMDLENLSETRCREITGAHIYAEIANLPAMVNDVTTDNDRRRLVQAIHVFQRESARIIAAAGGDRIHFQAARVHALVYRPVGDAEKRAIAAVLIQLMIDRYGRVFAASYPELREVKVRSGADHGVAIATRNGQRSDRELLFLGSPANLAAKLLPNGRSRRLTQNVYDLIPDDLQELAEEDGDVFSMSRPTSAELADLLAKYEIDWSEEAAAERLEADKADLPLDEIELAGARVLIAFDELTPRKSKYVLAATIYGDVSGFTAYIEGMSDVDGQKRALRNFHVIRKELAEVIRRDFGAIRVQYQGDRVQGLLHLPQTDSEAISSTSLDIAAGLQSSFEETLKPALDGIDGLGLAVGVGLQETIATKLGERGHRDRICLGSGVSRAEYNEEKAEKREVGIDGPTHRNLDEDLQSKFTWDSTRGAYFAKDLRVDAVEKAKATGALREGAVHMAVESGVVGVSASPSDRSTVVRPAKSWGDDAKRTAKGLGVVVVGTTLLTAAWVGVQRIVRPNG